jgi:hypothetical protein
LVLNTPVGIELSASAAYLAPSIVASKRTVLAYEAKLKVIVATNIASIGNATKTKSVTADPR